VSAIFNKTVVNSTVAMQTYEVDTSTAISVLQSYPTTVYKIQVSSQAAADKHRTWKIMIGSR